VCKKTLGNLAQRSYFITCSITR